VAYRVKFHTQEFDPVGKNSSEREEAQRLQAAVAQVFSVNGKHNSAWHG